MMILSSFSIYPYHDPKLEWAAVQQMHDCWPSCICENDRRFLAFKYIDMIRCAFNADDACKLAVELDMMGLDFHHDIIFMSAMHDETIKLVESSNSMYTVEMIEKMSTGLKSAGLIR